MSRLAAGCRAFAHRVFKRSDSAVTPASDAAKSPFWRSRWAAVAMLSLVSTAAITFLALHMQSFTVLDGSDRYVISTLSTDPAEAVQVAGVAIGEYDEVRRAGSYNELTIGRSFEVHVTVDGVTTAVRMTDGTVRDALEQVGVNLAGYRLINAQMTDTVSGGEDICVESALSYTERTEVETLDYTTEIQYTTSLPKGRVQVVRRGQTGSVTRVVRDTVVDGDVISTVTLSESRTEPINEIRQIGTRTGIAHSTAPYDIPLNEIGQPLSYRRVISGVCTAYTSDRGMAGTHTSTGRPASVGVVAVDPNVIPYGTELYIVSADGSCVYGYAIAGDTGGAARNGQIVCDLYMDTYEECVLFGRRSMNVYILN